jgi:ribosomal protein L37AE/L43A
MSEPTPPRVPAAPLQPIKSTAASGRAPISDDKMLCERCGQAEMYRMHAVWRCPSCGYKTDCCGW